MVLITNGSRRALGSERQPLAARLKEHHARSAPTRTPRLKSPALSTPQHAGAIQALASPPTAGPVLVPARASRDKTQAARLPRLSPAAALAHDARGAVTSLQLLSGLLAAPGVLAPSFAGYAADLQAVTDMLKALSTRIDGLDAMNEPDRPGNAVQQVLQPARPLSFMAGRQPTSRHAPSAREALESCVRLLQVVAGPSIAVHISSETDLPPIALDDDSLARVLMNLVKNAREAMPGGGAVRITGRRALGRDLPAVLVHVSDNGPGVPAHALGCIFEPGFTSKSHPGAAEHCGLGLAIVRELVEAASGEVRVASTRRRGTTFELRIPCLGSGQRDA